MLNVDHSCYTSPYFKLQVCPPVGVCKMEDLIVKFNLTGPHVWGERPRGFVYISRDLSPPNLVDSIVTSHCC